MIEYTSIEVMNMWLFLVFCAGLLGLGFFIDWVAKRKGLDNYNSEENVKHVSESERIYTETYMDHVRNEQHHGPL
ncbi:hypothetical protein [Cytobacillus purgationiresistens]|uniref:Uncharacterized protein n=1 Tax=Cytobacillus purgationiresistens TaxID=863449 RepID=A0ABU0ALR3_9BACI|nr:hypothetical protein [Cytobacillus purgationiresistens]MDQ0271819.1 hypothetical protein [Cytobacillus purgationiresistens]